MRYNLILLKDTPEWPAGTVFKQNGTVMHGWAFWETEGPYYDIAVPDGRGRYVCKNPSKYPYGCFLDDPSWVRREIDENYITDLKCPVCGSTQGMMFETSWYVRNMDSDDYGVQYSVGIECVCGHKRVLYGTRHGNKKLREKIEKCVQENKDIDGNLLGVRSND